MWPLPQISSILEVTENCFQESKIECWSITGHKSGGVFLLILSISNTVDTETLLSSWQEC